MKQVAFASGKGGSGKTTVVTSLACYLQRFGQRVQLLDCDVEEPNCGLFLKPSMPHAHEVTVSRPEVDASSCSGCDHCGRFCAYGAISCLGGKAQVFEELCHSCGGCMLVCPEHAISEKKAPIGRIELADADGISLATGEVFVGQPRAVPVIEAVKRMADPRSLVLIDAPPGTSCPVVATINDVSYVCLVAEPTPFGLHDLKLAVGLVRKLSRPFGVIVNRVGIGDDTVQDYCRSESIPILAEIPYQQSTAAALAEGVPAIDAAPELEPIFASLAEELDRLVEPETFRSCE